MSRSERRRAAREKQPVIIAGDNVVAAELGPRYEARPRVELDEKVPGEHRWICTAAWKIKVETVEDAHDPDVLKLLDNENLIELGIGCWDCEQPLGSIAAGSKCPAGDEWTKR